jgi:Rrf2 family protein
MTAEFSLAVHALVYLHAKKTELSSEELAANICTNPARVRKIMRGLKTAGLVSVKEGAGGGYLLAKNAGDISLRDIAEATGTNFVAASWRSGNIDMDCAVASGIAAEMDGIYAELDESCLKMLAHSSVADISRDLHARRNRK